MDGEASILALINTKREGILESDVLYLTCAMLSAEQSAQAIENLITQKSIERFESNNQQFLRARIETMQIRLTGNQLVVYRIIEMVGAKGITEDEIVTKMNGKNLPLKREIKKTLKMLHGEGFIQKIRSIQNKKEMLFVIMGLQPEDTITGGRWYTAEKDFDTAYVNALRNTCMDLVGKNANKGIFDAHDVHRWIVAHANTTDLPTADIIAQILHTLELDGKIQLHVKQIDESNSKIAIPPHPQIDTSYIACRSMTNSSILEAPCMSCKYLHECDPSGLGIISPMNCPYIEKWFM